MTIMRMIADLSVLPWWFAEEDQKREAALAKEQARADKKAQKREVRAALSNTFGFGGHNCCVVFKKYAE